MLLIAPLIYFLAWRNTRSIGQAFTETAAWIVGFLVTAGVILAANWGSIDFIDDRPDGPGSLIAILGGFAGMYVSHFMWKRRGGHLQRKEVPWARTLQAMRAGWSGAAERSKAAKATTTASRPSSSTTRPASSQPTAAQSTQSSARPAPKASGGANSSVSPTVRKAMQNRWVRASVRAAAAMMDDSKTSKNAKNKKK